MMSKFNFVYLLFTVLYPTSRGFSLAWLLAFTKSFASLVCHVVGYKLPIYVVSNSTASITCESKHLIQVIL